MSMMQPKKVYRYQRFNAKTVDALCNDLLYFSDPYHFNDPQDCKPTVESDSNNEILKQILFKLISKRVKDEVQKSLKASRLKGEKTFKHAIKHGKLAAQRELENIRYHATNPEYDGDNELAESLYLNSEIQRELLKRNDRGVCCFSSSFKNPLLWSHYGEQHYGLCVGYNLDRNPKPELHKVIYGGNRILSTSLIADALLNENHSSTKQLDNNVLLRKASPWRYEREWRLFDSRGLHSSPLKMIDITFGLRCPKSVIHSITMTLENRESSVNFYQIKETKGSFKLNRRLIEKDEMQTNLPSTACSGKEMFGSE